VVAFAQERPRHAPAFRADLVASLRSLYYAPYAETVSLLAERLGGVEWLEASRQAASVTAWLGGISAPSGGCPKCRFYAALSPHASGVCHPR
jgi:hypothetical protein